MDEQAEAGDRVQKASAWPLFVALGLALSEVGVILGLYPIAVGGLLLFVWSVAAIVHEAGYVTGPWKLLAALGVLLVVGGALVVYIRVGVDPGAALAVSDGVTARGLAIAGAGVVALAAGGVGVYLDATGR